ncbi:hypothetical protein TSMEX_003512, partial [Taenia solium]
SLGMRSGLQPYRIGPRDSRPSQGHGCFSPAAPASPAQLTHIEPSHRLLSVCCPQQNTDQSTPGPSCECYGPFTAIELDSSLTVPVPGNMKSFRLTIPSVVSWKDRCSMDPWESIKPIWIPDGGERLVTCVVNQRHTVLFSPLQQKF